MGGVAWGVINVQLYPAAAAAAAAAAGRRYSTNQFLRIHTRDTCSVLHCLDE